MMEYLEWDEPILIRDLPKSEIQAPLYEVEPFSVLDEQVIRHFKISLTLLDEKIGMTDLREDPQDRKEAEQSLCKSRSELFRDRTCYEIKALHLLPDDTARDAELRNYVEQVTEFPDKLKVFRHAIDAGNMTALSWLGDLRGEAERYALDHHDDPSYLAAYLIEELRAGLNVHTNNDIIPTLTKGIQPNSAINKNLIWSDYTDAVKDATLGAIIKEDFDLAQSLVSEFNEGHKTTTLLTSLIRIRQEKLQLKDVLKRNQYKNIDCFDLGKVTLKKAYVGFAKDISYNPYDTLIFAALDTTYPSSYIDKLFARSCGIKGCSQLSDRQVDFLAAVNPGAGRAYKIFIFNIMKNYYYNSESSQDNSQTLMKMSLLAYECGIEDENERSLKEIETELEILDSEHNHETSNIVNPDLVDRTRFKTYYNSHFSDLFKGAEAIASPTYRFKAIAKIASLQAKHDTSSGSKFDEMVQKLEEVSSMCEASIVDSSLLPKVERDAIIECITMIAYPDAKKEAS